jgi:hypothetical protein
MTTPDDFRRYAGECIESARTATDDISRKRFLELARMWMTAAQQLNDGMSVTLAPSNDDRASIARHRR